ncbi:unnamed protein product [Ambrosiozyma monospora]|uniref:Unnamed protein product n=1 Tax=Ambrosiozyma monospora TaxID=43982 RepID=A0A9W6Z628_AMBMO|nr:unnamed protein product [Ambrosiozyma monospora]
MPKLKRYLRASTSQVSQLTQQHISQLSFMAYQYHNIHGGVLHGETNSKPKDASSGKKTFTYSKIFEKVTHQRLKYYNKISFIVAFLLTTLVIIPFKTSWFMFPVKLIMIWSGLLFIKQARDITLKIDASTHSTALQHFLFTTFSSDFFSCAVAYLYAALCVYLTIYFQSGVGLNYYISSPTKTVKPFINDLFVFYWFHYFFFGLVYAAQFLTLEKNRLPLKVGVYRLDPIDQLKSIKWKSLAEESASISGFVSLLAPIFYFSSRKFIISVVLSPFVYIFDLNRRIPKANFSFTVYIQLFILSFLITFAFELVNKVYNIYSMVGCLNVKKPLSQYSEDPVDTLVSGLSDVKKPFTRFTAFQELAYLASHTDTVKTSIFYSSMNWKQLFEQCNSVIILSSRTIRSDLPHSKKPAPPKESKPEPPKPADPSSAAASQQPQPSQPEIHLFGNSRGSKARQDQHNNNNHSDQHTVDMGNTTVMHKTIDPDELFLTPPTSVKKPSKPAATKANPKPQDTLTQIQKTLVTLYTQLKTNPTLKKLQLQLQQKLESDTKQAKILTKLLKLTQTMFNILIGRSLQREANKRLPNKYNLSHAIIAISEVLLHAKSIDKKRVVIGGPQPTASSSSSNADPVVSNGTGSGLGLGDVLTSLTRVYIATSDFINDPPVVVDQSEKDVLADGEPKTEELNSIVEVNQLALDYFFKLIILYNSEVNDIVLTPEVFKLAKWCTDLALDEQRNQRWDEEFDF